MLDRLPPAPPPPPPPKPKTDPTVTTTAVHPTDNSASSFTPSVKAQYAPITPIAPIDLSEVPGSVRTAVADGNQVVDALNAGGPAAAAAKLKQLFVADANMKDPDHAGYATALAGATAKDVAQSLDDDPANATANFQNYLAAIPLDLTQARSNLVATAVNAATTPQGRQAIVAGAGSVVAQHASTPQDLSDFLGLVQDPASQSALAAQAAPAIAQQISVKANTDPVGAAQLLDQYVAAAPDAASRKAIIDAAGPAVSQIVSKVNQNVKDHLGEVPEGDAGVDSVIESLGHAGQLAGPDGTKSLTDAMAKSVGDAQFSDTAPSFANLWRRGFEVEGQTHGDTTIPLATSLRDSLAAAGKGRPANELDQVLQPSAAGYLSQAQGHYDDAKGKVEQDNADLSTELSRIGPGLTDSQKQQYIAAFHKQHAADYADQATQATALGQALKTVGPSLLNSNSPDAVRSAMNAADALAKTPEGAEAAKDFVSLVANNPTSPLHNQLRLQLGDDEAVKAKCEDVLKNAIPNLYAKDVADAGGDPNEATKKLKEQLESVERSKILASDANQIVQGLNALQSNDFNALKELGSGPLGNAFKGAGVVLGIAKAANGDSDPTAYIQNLASTGKEGAELIAAATKSLSDTLPAAADAGELIGKFAPGLGLVANALATSQDFQALVHGGNAGDAVKLLGDSVATLGSVLDVTGVGAVVGVPLQMIGSLVSVIGSAISNDIHADHWNGEEKNLLSQIGLGSVSGALSSADPEALKTVADDGKLTPEQVQQLAHDRPEIFQAAGYAQAFLDAANACGMHGADAVNFAGALAKDDPNYMDLLFNQRSTKDGIHNAEHDAVLRGVLLQSGRYPSATAYAHQHAPQLFGQNAQQQQQADLDYENRSMGGGDLFMTLGNDLKRNSDPSYQAELIGRLQKDGMLDGWAKRMGSDYAYNGWPEAATKAIQAAQQQGVLSASDAQKYLASIQGH